MTEVSKEDFRDLDRDVGQMSMKVAALQVEVQQLNRTLAELVSKAEFFPVKMIAYGLAGGALTALMTAVISNVVQR